MNAHKGDKIVCKCGQPAGSFLENVDDGATISSEDIDLEVTLALDNPDRYVCSHCNEPVAYLVSGRWQVMTTKGWRE